MPFRLEPGVLLKSCVAVDGNSLAVVPETAGVLGLAELVLVDDEVPETDSMAS